MALKDSLQAIKGKALAAAVGVHPVTICAWKRGASLPPRTRIPALAAALGMPVDQLAAMVDAERAELLGVTRATANAALRVLQAKRLVERGYGRIRVPDRERLAAYALA